MNSEEEQRHVVCKAGGEAWRADASCVSFHIPLQLQRKRGGDRKAVVCHVTKHPLNANG